MASVCDTSNIIAIDGSETLAIHVDRRTWSLFGEFW
jgi:hypothetical protein